MFWSKHLGSWNKNAQDNEISGEVDRMSATEMVDLDPIPR